jgi:hypothetical protein
MGAPDLTAFRLPSTDALDGRTVTLEGGGTLRIDKSWDVVEIAPGTYFADVGLPGHDALTVVLSLATGWALTVGQRRDPAVTGRGPAAEHTFTVARIAGLEQSGPAPAPTRDLVGRWHRYRYSPDNLYEHIYISDDRFVSHNVATEGTPDRADCHPVSYWKVAPCLYLIAWREFDSQASMVMAENLVDLRVTGKVLHPASPASSVSVPIGGVIRPATVTFPEEEGS